MRQKRLGERALSIIENALRVAADQYESHSADFHQIEEALGRGQSVPPFADGKPGAVAAHRLAEQFRVQAEQARRLIELLDEADEIFASRYEDEEG